MKDMGQRREGASGHAHTERQHNELGVGTLPGGDC